jgi:hypothetical protein
MVTVVTIALIAIFASGIVLGVIATVSIGISREERRFRKTQFVRGQYVFPKQDSPMRGFLQENPPDRVALSARCFSGLFVRRLQAAATTNDSRHLNS